MKLFFNTIIRVMRLTCILLFVSIGFAFASGSYAQGTYITMNLSDKTVAEVLETIENETEFNFYYNNKLINASRLVSVNVKNKHVYTVLEQMFRGYDVSYKVVDRDIILMASVTPGVKEQSQARVSVSGTVTDVSGEPIVGANVIEKGTTNGISTGIDGSFKLTVPEAAVLQISYIGYITQDVNVSQFLLTGGGANP
jgi:hypothetical protein